MVQTHQGRPKSTAGRFRKRTSESLSALQRRGRLARLAHCSRWVLAALLVASTLALSLVPASAWAQAGGAAKEDGANAPIEQSIRGYSSASRGIAGELDRLPTDGAPSAYPEPLSNSGLQPLTGDGPWIGADGYGDPNLVEAGGGVLGQSVNLGEAGNLSLTTSPDPDNLSIGSNYSFRSALGWIRQAQVGIYANEEQVLYTAGGIFSIFERDGYGIGARTLLTGSDYTIPSSSVGGTVDLFGGGRFQGRYGEHWWKASVFYDYQGDYSRVGPGLSALFFANEANPITADFAMGWGFGDDILYNQGRDVFEVADRDYQLRLGMFLSPRVQLGITGNLAEFSNAIVHDNVWGGGAFTNLYFERYRVGLDLTGTGEGVRGFATLSYVFGGSPRIGKPCAAHNAWCIDGQSWLMQPVNRDIAVRTRGRQRTFAERGLGVGNVVRVSGGVRYQDPARSGPVQPGDVLEFVPSCTTGEETAINVVIGPTAPVVIGPASLNSPDFTTTFPAVPPNTTVSSSPFGDFDVVVNNPASGSVVVEFVVDADGQSRSFRFSPVTIGVTSLPAGSAIQPLGVAPIN